MRIDENTLEQARNADVIAFLEKYSGFAFVLRGRAYRCKQHPSLAVDSNRLSWFWHSKGIGGFGAVDYLMKSENISFREAVEVFTGTTPTAAEVRQNETKMPKVLSLPEKSGVPLHLYEYLYNKRGIDGEVVNALIQRKMLYEDKRGNGVFVGYDEQGNARFASLRGTYGDCRFRSDCQGSDKRYGFTMVAYTPTKRLYIFESPIDAMSHASLTNAATGDTGAWKGQSRLSLAGISDTAMPFFLNQHSEVIELVFCLDNDDPGRGSAEGMAKKYAAKGYEVRIKPPASKDFNDDLQSLRAQEKAKKRTKTIHQNLSI